MLKGLRQKIESKRNSKRRFWQFLVLTKDFFWKISVYIKMMPAIISGFILKNILKKEKIVIGLGTGRCGTLSLSMLLKKQKYFSSTHEEEPIMPWIFSENAIKNKVKLIRNRPYANNSDCGFYYLPYVEWLIDFSKSKNIKIYFICLKRDKKMTVDSFLKWTEPKKLNHWQVHNGKQWKFSPNWDKAFPKYKTDSKAEALEKYYDYYYQTAQQLESKYSNFKIFPTDYLNSEKGIKNILDFIGLPEKGQVLEKFWAHKCNSK